jgi:hypothetical protein
MSRFLLTVAILFVAVLGAVAIAVAVGSGRWGGATEASVTALRRASDTATAAGARFDPADVASLPPPVARYFARVLTPGQRLVHRATIRHAGDFALKPGEWKPFTSRQLYTTRPRGFVWDATIRFLPFLPLRVRDSYVAGVGSMLGSLAGVVTVVDQRGTPAMAESSLLRYLAELTWLPTALLPRAGVQWTARDDSSATASLVDGAHAVSMDVFFGAGGSIVRILATRGRDVKGTSVPTPWEGEFSDSLLTVDGMQIPLTGQVSWLLPDGKHTYWRGRIVDATYEYRE